MNTILEMWLKNREAFETKKLPQILSFAGDGKLKDENITSSEFRELLSEVPSVFLKRFAENCLTDKFDDSGFALQDIINQIGARLGFTVEHGRYRGKQKEIGFDGIWTSDEGHSIVLETKTTDVYRINLDTIAVYRDKLIDESKINKANSSILIVVGREDTGDLEAQIRGSQHAWDIRLISTDSLLNLLSIKESLDERKTIQQINELLKPREYTKVDKLIDLIFLTSKDLQLEETAALDVEDYIGDHKAIKTSDFRDAPVNFRDACFEKIKTYLGVNLMKDTRTLYIDKSKSIGVVCSTSKLYEQGKVKRFWFKFHPNHDNFLKKLDIAFVAFGCGSPDNIILIPYKEFRPQTDFFLTTDMGNDVVYWHVDIRLEEKKYYIVHSEIKSKPKLVEITKYLI